MFPALAALVAACGYGTANLLGGLASRRQHAAITLLLSQATAFPIVLAAAWLSAGRPGDAGWGAGAGVLGFCGAACAYLCFSLGRPVGIAARSDEHTSELQSRRDLVCRLLLEKK